MQSARSMHRDRFNAQEPPGNARGQWPGPLIRLRLGRLSGYGRQGRKGGLVVDLKPQHQQAGGEL